MFKKLMVTYLLLLMTVVSTGTLASSPSGAPVAPTTVQVTDAIPTASTAAAASAAAERVQLSVAQMTEAQGDGIWGWLKKVWKKHKKTILKLIWEIISTIITTEINESSSYVEGINGTVTETYEASEETENVYASQADYDAGNVQSSSYYNSGYSYAGSDYSYGYVEY